ncbi:hypothetical protein OA39_04986 [Vibrio campbellii]|uniref:hypothetical protein n=1 Tax=Vibrio harveyi group TaxID=717610 RepID=UPI000531694B|nr:hypothetical protein [Vibrio campbellii]KGR32644.1 hypothetical protein OA39_04986 [Vibrio campbellii]
MTNLTKTVIGFWLIGLSIAIVAKEGWLIPNREYAHFWGLLGVTFMCLSYACDLLGKGSAPIFWLCSHAILLVVYGLVESYSKELWCFRFIVPLILYAFYLFFLKSDLVNESRTFVRDKIGGKINAKFSTILAAACLGFLASWLWELIWQPLIGVYGDDARGTIQSYHIIPDALGILSAVFIMCVLLPNKAFKTDSQRSALSD